MAHGPSKNKQPTGKKQNMEKISRVKKFLDSNFSRVKFFLQPWTFSSEVISSHTHNIEKCLSPKKFFHSRDFFPVQSTEGFHPSDPAVMRLTDHGRSQGRDQVIGVDPSSMVPKK
jgi:hypothetical protein